MSTSALLKKVRKIEIKTRGLSNHIFAGEYHTAFKGKGMAFSEVREYQVGVDVIRVEVRRIDLLKDTANLRIFYYEQDSE